MNPFLLTDEGQHGVVYDIDQKCIFVGEEDISCYITESATIDLNIIKEQVMKVMIWM
jgi:hypothetical protein